LLGFKPEDFLTSRVRLQDRIHPGDSEIADLLFCREKPDQMQAIPGSFNLRIRHADGRIRCIRGQSTRLVGSGGEAILDLLLQDAKSLWKGPQDQPLPANLRAMLESTDNFIFFKDRNHVTCISHSVGAVLDHLRPGPSLLGLTDYDLFSEKTADAFYSLEETIFQGAPVAHGIQETQFKDGRSFWIDIRTYPIRGEDGQVIGLFGIAREITERVQITERLRESEEFLRESQRIARLGSYVLDFRSGIWSSSDVLDQVFGIRKDYERTVEGWLALIHPEDRAMMSVYFAEQVADLGTPFDREYRIVRQNDHAERWVHGLGRLEFDAQGHPGKMYGTIQDITERKQADAALRHSKDLLQLFIDHTPTDIAMFDREMCYLAASRRWIEERGLVGQKIIGSFYYETSPCIPEAWKQAHRRGLAGEATGATEDRIERPEGKERWVRWEVVPWRTAEGEVGGIIVFSVDITKHKKTEDRLRLAASVFTHAREGILITAPDGTILDVNDAFNRITGYTREETLGQSPRMLRSGLQSKQFYASLWETLLETGQWSGEIWNRTKNGEMFAEMLTISAVRDAEGKVQQYVALFSDITVLKEHERKLEQIAHYDMLTGLPNRVLLADRLHQAMAQALRHNRLVAVAYLDLDGFKAINDRHGHAAGDQLLTVLAERMKHALREGDTLARLGGDEFVAVLLDLSDTAASLPVLTRLLDAASEPAQLGELALRVSASVGVTFYPQPEETEADQLLRQADQAMYYAKLAGRNRFQIFDSSRDRSVRGHLENLEYIRQGMKAHEFVLYYQPVVNMRTGTLVGAEALIRWRHPEMGLLPPISFLPVVEDHPLAIELGEWVIDTALAQMEAWQEIGLNIPVSVNIGAQQLQRTGFVQRLVALLAAHPTVKPSSLELEILETNALHDMTQVSQILENCRNLGVSVALDDFGTGYSSLTYLKRLPTNVLKIDQSFVREMLDDAENLTILEGILGLALALSRKVIAEGVETPEQSLMLLQLGCELAQGFGIARPMPADDLPRWLAEWRPDTRNADLPNVSFNDRPLLYAAIEHRAWVAALEAFLRGKRSAPPSLDQDRCRLGVWLDGESVAGRAALPAFQALQAIHCQLHALTAEILASQTHDLKADPLAHLDEIHGLRDELLAQLKTFRQQS
jgi:diguanylate cyclase (GGDEF)-like protein/PAS domain S-box-containing protein